jgi:TonB family protein
MARILQGVKENWYRLIPPSAEKKKGELAIEFSVAKDGNVAGMKLVASSGASILDRAAWGGITASSPFPPLPTDFTGPYLALRFRFSYNPDAADLAPANSTASVPAPIIVHAMLMPNVSDSHLPKYPKKARQTRVQGIVRLDAEVGRDGKVKDVKVFEGDQMLADASIQAIRKWRFYPAQRDGRPVEDRARIRIDFRLDQEQAWAQVVSYPGPSPSPAQ